MSQQTLIDKNFLEKLERLSIRWQRSFPGLVGGHNRSSYSGPGQEFLDHRRFHHGDDLRAVNWRAYLRFEKLFMKMFHTEPRVPVRLLLDVSRSMETGGGSKFQYARRLAAALCYVGMVRLDTISIMPFSAGLGDPYVCMGGRHRFGPAADYLSSLEAQGETNYLAVSRDFTSRFRQRGLAIIISDFLDDEGSDKPLQYLADFGHELLLIQVWDEEDRNPPWEGELRLVDAETGTVHDTDFDRSARARYTESFDDYSRALHRVAVVSGGRYVGLSTDVSIEDAIFGPVSQVRRVQ